MYVWPWKYQFHLEEWNVQAPQHNYPNSQGSENHAQAQAPTK